MRLTLAIGCLFLNGCAIDSGPIWTSSGQAKVKASMSQLGQSLDQLGNQAAAGAAAYCDAVAAGEAARANSYAQSSYNWDQFRLESQLRDIR